MYEIVDRLERDHYASKEELRELLTTRDDTMISYLFSRARKVTTERFGNKIYIRGLIEFSNYCKQNCLYCGLRHDNKEVERYRLTKEEILE